MIKSDVIFGHSVKKIFMSDTIRFILYEQKNNNKFKNNKLCTFIVLHASFMQNQTDNQ